MTPVRIFFHKTGRAKYISHLDIYRCMQRAVKRSGLPVWYTEGFNPHMYLTFALPISLGYESICESMDFKLTEPVEFDQIVKRLNNCLPPDLQAYSAAEPVMKTEKIFWADYQIRLESENCLPEELAKSLEASCETSPLMVMKKTKKGEKEIDISPLFSCSKIQTESDGVTFRLRTRAGNEVNLNPSLVIQELEKQAKQKIFAAVTRIAILTEECKNFC